jgi:outer membrane protein assembly factor BamB
MADPRTYLELSEEQGVAHKFYEVVVEGTDVTIRYGRIGTDGQKKTHSHGSTDAAHAFADKKIAAKKKKGYEPAVMGVRKKRAITRRQIKSTKSTAKTKAPTIWRFDSGAAAFGVFIDDDRCWVGNQDGRIFALDHDGQVTMQFKLPDGVKCVVADGEWLYAGCDNGSVYDLTGKVPREAYEIAENIDIYWLDIRDGVLGVSDSDGNVVIINHEDESQWSKKSSGSSGWMVRCDEIGVYHGHQNGVTMYDWEDGSVVWNQETRGSVLFGWQEESTVYAGTGDSKVYQFTKKGEPGKVFEADGSVYSCAAAEDGKYVFAGDSSSSIYCWDADGKRLWKMNTGCGSAFSMQYHKGRVYLVTTDGSLACIDASEEAIKAAEQGQTREFKAIKAPPAKRDVAVSTSVETTSDASSGVVVECIEKDGRLRVRVISEGFNEDWSVQFPRALRENGARFVVDEVREASRGGFYRVLGEIRKLEG